MLHERRGFDISQKEVGVGHATLYFSFLALAKLWKEIVD
jgi:hypothetical protein